MNTKIQDAIIEKMENEVLKKLNKEPRKLRNKKYAEILGVTEWFACQVINGKRRMSERTILLLQYHFSEKNTKKEKKHLTIVK